MVGQRDRQSQKGRFHHICLEEYPCCQKSKAVHDHFGEQIPAKQDEIEFLQRRIGQQLKGQRRHGNEHDEFVQHHGHLEIENAAPSEDEAKGTDSKNRQYAIQEVMKHRCSPFGLVFTRVCTACLFENGEAGACVIGKEEPAISHAMSCHKGKTVLDQSSKLSETNS